MALMPIPDRWPSLPGMGLIGPRIWRGAPAGSSEAPALDLLLDDFTRRWERGEAPRAEDYVGLFPAGAAEGPLELIYHEYCLAESSGLAPDPSSYFLRFPELEGRLRKVLGAHGAMPGFLGLEPGPEMPAAGDEIGPFLLVRELGRGSFARVFLARQTDLGDRALVVKVSARPTAEARLMARADHPHIVPILRDAQTEEGLHLVCMPFLGGATLAAVLGQLGRLGRRPGWGGALLEALDSVSAREYSAALAAGAIREQLDRMSYPRSIAWMLSRLAGALDHAFAKGVTHGDLKPSNILLAADGRPMLLDFNLSTDWTEAGSELSGDAGGTLAYMAPERLRALADRREGFHPPLRPIDRHRADVYSLGLILLEALTGRRPESPAPGPPDESPAELAGRLARLRGGLPTGPGPRRAAGPLSRSSWPATVPAGLRPILSRCLDPVPSRRYKHARQLSEDLDRWREELPLKHARPSRWAELGRHLHRQRRAIMAALVVWASFAAVGGLIWRAKRVERREQSLHDVAQYWDHVDSGAYRYRAPGRTRVTVGEDQDRLAVAWALLDRYGVAEDPRWRERAAFSLLPERERQDLEALLLEQGVRFVFEISRPEYESLPRDRAVAVAVLENLGPDARGAGLAPLRRRFGLEVAADPATKVAGWRPVYLAATMAELATAADAQRLGLDGGITEPRAILRSFLQLAAEQPDSFWFQYRAAVVASRLREHEIAEAALLRALSLRPCSAPAYLALAVSLYYQKRYPEAWAACEKAMALDPRSGTVARTAYFLAEDEARKKAALARYQAMLGPRKTAAMARLGAELRQLASPALLMSSSLLAANQIDGALSDADLIYWRGYALLEEGRCREALDEFDQLLRLDPCHLGARRDRGVALQWLNRMEEALAEYEQVLDSPRFEELLAQQPESVVTYLIAAAGHLRRGEEAEGIALSARGLARATELNRRVGEAHYALGRAYGVAALNDVTMLRESAHEMLAAGAYSEKFLSEILCHDPLMSPILPALWSEMADVASRDR